MENLLEGKRIAIFGATSKIASATVVRALAEGANITAVVRNKTKAESLERAGAKVVEGDVRDRARIFKILGSTSPDVTINFAAGFDMSADISRSKAVNVDGEKNILDGSNYCRVGRHIFISSTGIKIKGPNAYKDTKLEAEQLVRNSRIPEWMILRYGNVVGTTDPDDLWNKPFKIIEIMGRKLGLTISAPYDYPFPYLGVETATEATLAAINAESNQTITVLDGFTTIGEYIEASKRKNGIDQVIGIPFQPTVCLVDILNWAYRRSGRYFPVTAGAVRAIFEPADFTNQDMIEKLGVRPRSFNEVIRN